MQTDILIVGNGIAALSLVYHLTELGIEKDIIVLSEQPTSESNSYHAQGGIAVEFGDKPSKYQHIKDTMSCGIINNQVSTTTILNEAEKSIQSMIKDGLVFDADEKGNLSKRLEGGHSNRRILYHSDTSGKHIIDFLIKKVNQNKKVKILQDTYCYELLKENNTCIGAKIFDTKTNRIDVIFASKIVLATGGAGALYNYTSNSSYSIGSGVILAQEIGAEITNMEFIQFHPTAYVSPKKTILISEALRGEGAFIINQKGKRIPGVELFTRDKLARILYEGIRNGDNYFLDCTNIQDSELDKFSYITNNLADNGIDIRITPIPIKPVAHYMCGGITTDAKGKTSINNLYAIGEVANSGLHGANRLASNSLTEAVTVPYLLTLDLLNNEWTKVYYKTRTIHYTEDESNYDIKIEILRKEMWKKCGIVRTSNALAELRSYIKTELHSITENTGLSYPKLRYSTMLKTAAIIVESSLNRNKNVGTFWKE